MATTQDGLGALFAKRLIDALVSGGVRHFCLSPGYRHTPLVLAVANRSMIETVVHIDERGMAFCALGIAKATRAPVVMIVTSGTALAHLLPAIMEASASHLPLIALSADRPPELRGTGANQTTDQVKIYQPFVRYQVDLPCPSCDLPPNFIEQEVSTALLFAQGTRPGPVHLNCPFRKPFFKPTYSLTNKSTRALHLGRPMLLDAAITLLANKLKSINNGVILAGNLDAPNATLSLLALAETLKWPIFADILSPLRQMSAHPLVVTNYALILDKAPFFPRAVLQFGEQFVSSSLLSFLKRAKPPFYAHITPHPDRFDPGHLVTDRVITDSVPFCARLCELLAQRSPTSWLKGWQAARERAFALTDQFFASKKTLSQPSLFYNLSTILPPHTPVFIANSTPIRYADALHYPPQTGGTLFGNRGLSGIDGNIGTLIGIARGLKTGVVALLGDLAFLHDLNSLAQLRDVPFPITLFVINNGGGAIFSDVLIKANKAVFNRYFFTPHHLNFEAIASLFNLNYKRLDALEFNLNASHTLVELVINPSQDQLAMKGLKEALTPLFAKEEMLR